MNAFLLVITIFCLTMQTVTKRFYNDKTKADGKYFFSAVVAFAAMMFFVLTSKQLNFEFEILLYSSLFALFYAIATVFSFVAISCGSLSVTALIISYSLLIPTFYGLIFLKETVDAGLYLGIVFLVISLYLISKKADKAKITVKWIVSVILAFAGNGMCTVIQKMQQSAFDGAYKNEFMITALFLVAVFLGIISFANERKSVKFCFKNSQSHISIGELHFD